MIEFDAGANAWEDGPTVVPCSGARMTKEHFTNMLRGGGHLNDDVSVAILKKIPLALQVGLGRIVALCYCLSTSCQIH